MPYLRLLLLACVVAWLPGCDNTPDTDEPAPEGALTVLPVGDSRVQGARPRFESYRYELWKNFVSDDQPVDFVGPLDDEASYPGFQGQRFDDDHAGVGGFTTLDVLNSFDEIQGSLDEAPGVVLLGIGGNDLLSNRTPEETFASLNEIIDRFQAAHPNATIIVEQIAPGLSRFMTAERQRVF
ncbi:MAG: SGNH/GDSL hydrolase family protein, partial [Bacteroidota bacterium]